VREGPAPAAPSTVGGAAAPEALLPPTATRTTERVMEGEETIVRGAAAVSWGVRPRIAAATRGASVARTPALPAASACPALEVELELLALLRLLLL